VLGILFNISLAILTIIKLLPKKSNQNNNYKFRFNITAEVDNGKVNKKYQKRKNRPHRKKAFFERK
jgi:hypothetical protein